MATKTKKLGTIRSGILRMKLRAPSGIQLDAKETTAIIDLWKDDKKVMETNSADLIQAELAIKAIVQHKVPDILVELNAARSEAVRFFKITKDPLKKREWARRLVVAERARNSVKDSQQRMQGVTERIKAVVSDASLEKQALEVRIAEAEAYQKMGKGLHLVGDSLINARIRAKSSKVEFMNLELGIESIEKTVSQTSDSAIVEEANKILRESATIVV